MNNRKLATAAVVAALALATAACGGESEAEDAPKVPAVTSCITPVPPHTTTPAPSTEKSAEPAPHQEDDSSVADKAAR